MNLLKLSLLFLFVGSWSQASDKIHSASNVEGNSVIVETSGSPRRFLKINMETAKASTMVWPKTLKSEEVLGSFLLADKFYVIAQWTAGDGKRPLLFEYDRHQHVWSKKITTIDCISFDKLEVKAAKLTIECEADPQAGLPAKKITVSLATQSKQALSLEFPLAAHKVDKFSYKLTGDMFAWNSIELRKDPDFTRTLTAEDLFKVK